MDTLSLSVGFVAGLLVSAMIFVAVGWWYKRDY